MRPNLKSSLRSGFGELCVAPPAVMVITACLTLLFLSDFRAGDGAAMERPPETVAAGVVRLPASLFASQPYEHPEPASATGPELLVVAAAGSAPAGASGIGAMPRSDSSSGPVVVAKAGTDRSDARPAGEPVALPEGYSHEFAGPPRPERDSGESVETSPSSPDAAAQAVQEPQELMVLASVLSSGATAADAFVGPPAPSNLPETETATATDAAEGDEVPDPKHNFSFTIAAASVSGADAAKHPDRPVAAKSDSAQAAAPVDRSACDSVGPPRPGETVPAVCLLDGPPQPTVVADASLELHAVGAHVGHGLPFDPLTVGPFGADGKTPSHSQRPNPFAEFLATQDDLHTVEYTREIRHKIHAGETMSEVLGNLGLSAAQADEWLRAASKKHSLNRVYAGQEVDLLVRMPQRELLRLQLEVGSDRILTAERTAEGVTARLDEIEYEQNLRVVGAKIEHSLYVAAQSQGVPDKIISDMAEILGWDINLGRELLPGSTFRVVYEEMTRNDTGESVPGRVLAVDLFNRGKKYEGFYFKTAEGARGGYYDRKGESLGRAFLRYPVSFSRISSQFTTKRFHPVLKRNIPHYGVDFAAPTGTPVKAVADGRVLKAGWYGGNGRFVKIRHDSVYQSGYAHLSRIPSGIREGGYVKKGQIIGFVGSTGLATGPHLHFAMYRYGKYIDPLHTKLPRAQSLTGNSLAAFRMRVDMMDRAYAKADQAGEPSRVAASSR